MNEYYFNKYGIDTHCEIEAIIDIFDDNEKINVLKMILDNLKSWWGACINDLQEEKEYNKLCVIINDLKELIEMRKGE